MGATHLMKTLTVGGVPEHVNLPWYLAVEEGRFEDLGLDVRWKDCPAGTGQMCEGLESGELDVALLLTEGAVAHIGNGGTCRIVGTFVETPLIWGIHTRADAPFEDPEGLRGRRYGISRKGSGSHLMAFVDAAQRGWPPEDHPKTVKVGGLGGALDAFREGRIDAFMWEKYMTKPLVDDGHLKRVGTCTAPWPAFVLAARPLAVENLGEELGGVMARVARESEALAAAPERVVEEVVARFGLLAQDVEAWLLQTRWDCRASVSEAALRQAARHLVGVGVLEREPDLKGLTAPGLCALT